ncbi:MAG: hypothetical protein MUC58_06545 [Rhizobiaceae bacterium]|nr:hypothetical protein [Rhizobiaceae bacterium]
MIYAMIFEKFFVGELVFYMIACWATWMTGKAIASTWQSKAKFALAAIGLAAAVRFLHYALYEGPFLSPVHYVSDLFVLSAVGLAAYQYTRTNQMVSQYHWLYERASPLSWRDKTR